MNFLSDLSYKNKRGFDFKIIVYWGAVEALICCKEIISLGVWVQTHLLLERILFELSSFRQERHILFLSTKKYSGIPNFSLNIIVYLLWSSAA
jgi:hypothetical protein